MSVRSISIRSQPILAAAILLCVAIAALLLAVILHPSEGQFASAGVLGCGDDSRSKEKPFQQLDFNKLDYGIYWYGRDNHCQKALSGESNPYFDPVRPTVLYVHGWEADTTKRHFRENFYIEPEYSGVPPYLNTANSWIDGGWNVGIFYWNQFSDDTSPTFAEGKIWSANGPGAMRWRTLDGSFLPGPQQSQSAGELLYEAYVNALGVGRGQKHSPNVRLVGHSLGAQMVTYLAETVSERRPDLLPKRIALLDPYFSLGPQPYLAGGAGGDTAGERVRGYVDNLIKKGVVFEQYQTTALGDISGSILGFGGNDPNPNLQKETALVRLYPDYVPWFNPVKWFHDQHVAAISWYFWSYSYPAIPQCSAGSAGSAGGAKSAQSARSTDEEIRAFMGSDLKFVQVDGKGSADPGKSCLEPIVR